MEDKENSVRLTHRAAARKRGASVAASASQSLPRGQPPAKRRKCRALGELKNIPFQPDEIKPSYSTRVLKARREGKVSRIFSAKSTSPFSPPSCRLQDFAVRLVPKILPSGSSRPSIPSPHFESSVAEQSPCLAFRLPPFRTSDRRLRLRFTLPPSSLPPNKALRSLRPPCLGGSPPSPPTSLAASVARPRLHPPPVSPVSLAASASRRHAEPDRLTALVSPCDC